MLVVGFSKGAADFLRQAVKEGARVTLVAEIDALTKEAFSALNGLVSWFNRSFKPSDATARFAVFVANSIHNDSMLFEISNVCEKNHILVINEDAVLSSDDACSSSSKSSNTLNEMEHNVIPHVYRGYSNDKFWIESIPSFSAKNCLVYSMSTVQLDQFEAALLRQLYPQCLSVVILNAPNLAYISTVTIADLSLSRFPKTANVVVIVGDAAANTATELTSANQNADTLGLSIPLLSSIVPQLSSPKSTVKEIAAMFSDITFHFDLLDGKAYEKQLPITSVTLNIWGVPTTQVAMTNCPESSSVLEGAYSPGTKIAAILPYAAIGLLLPTIYRFVKKQAPAVFHVAMGAIPAALKGTSGSNYWDATVNSGSVVLCSATTQEAYDLALVAHLIAQSLDSPAIHFFDGELPIVESIKAIAIDKDSMLAIAAELSELGLPRQAAVESVFRIVASKTGREVNPVLEIGPKDSEILLVTVGSIRSSASSAVRFLASNSCSVGQLHISQIRPWPSHLIEKLISVNVRQIHVIETEEDGFSYSQLLKDIKTILLHKIWDKKAPEIYIRTFAATIPQDIVKYLHDYFEDDPGLSEPFCLGQVAKDIREISFWDSNSTSTIDNEMLLKDIVTNEGHFVQQIDLNMSTPNSILHCSQFRISNSPINENHWMADPAIVIVNDIGILATYNALSLRSGSTLVLNTTYSAAELLTELTPEILFNIQERDIELKYVNARQISKDFTIFYGNQTDYESAIMEAVVYRVAYPGDDCFLMAQKQEIIDRFEYNVAVTKLEAIEKALKTLSSADIGKFTGSFEGIRTLESSTIKHSYLQPIIFSEDSNKEEKKVKEVNIDNLMLPLLFTSEFAATKVLRVDLENSFQVTVSKNVRLTPLDYDRNVFHIELDILSSGLRYAIGDALGVFAPNNVNEVRSFIEAAKLDPHQLIAIDTVTDDGEKCRQYKTFQNLLTYELDVFGKPVKAFYQKLVTRCSIYEDKDKIASLLEDNARFEEYTNAESPTFADLILRFPSSSWTAKELVESLPAIKPRLYSISSSQMVHPNSLHLLIVLVEWETSTKAQRFGHATRFLESARPGETVTVIIKPSAMKLPPSHSSPIVMSGLGTGMAPFRAFIQERWYWKNKGKKVGPILLYFGSRFRSMEYLYGEELDAYNKDGLLTHLRLAFSRDQKEKVYIQHKIEEDAELLHDLIVNQKGSFYLCGPTWPVPDIAAALLKSFSISKSYAESQKYLENLKEEERYILEVY